MNEPTADAAFEALLDHRGRDLLLLVDDNLRIVGAGAEAAEIARRPRASLAGMSLIAAFGSGSLDAVARRCASSGRAQTGEAELDPSAPRIHVIDAIPLPRGGMVLALRDISTLRRAERARRDLLANVSHELRTPLTSVRLLAESIASGSVDDAPTVRDFASQIERETDRLATLVDELLDLGRIESGETHLALEAVDPGAVVATCIERIRPVGDRRDVTVSQLPDPTDSARAMADAARLEQALLNLAHNAVKFSHPGGEVRIGWSATNARVRFSVADDGLGVPLAHQARIFERFYKVDRSRARTEDEIGSDDQSAGLGLAIVRHIAEAHGGSAGTSSVEGVGSTFWIEVRRA